MSQPTSFDPPAAGDRPICSTCGWTMWITLVEPHHEPDCEKHTFSCHRCEYEEIRIVRL